MTPLIKSDAVILVAKCQTDQVPGVRIQPTSMEKHDCRLAVCSPVQVMESHLVDDNLDAGREANLEIRESRYLGCKSQVLELFIRGEYAHSSLLRYLECPKYRVKIP